MVVCAGHMTSSSVSSSSLLIILIGKSPVSSTLFLSMVWEMGGWENKILFLAHWISSTTQILSFITGLLPPLSFHFPPHFLTGTNHNPILEISKPTSCLFFLQISLLSVKGNQIRGDTNYNQYVLENLLLIKMLLARADNCTTFTYPFP